MNAFDRAIGYVAPRWQLSRMRARSAVMLLERTLEGAGGGRRGAGWRRSRADGNTATGPYLAALRANARQMVAENPYAESAMATIEDQVVGWGIAVKGEPMSDALRARWRQWADTTACDADGRNTFAGLQKMVARAVAQDGEVLVRRRIRKLDDGLPLPVQVQVIEADYLDTQRDAHLPGGGRIVQGVEFDAIGRRVAYWLYRDHPGDVLGWRGASERIPAESVLHVFRPKRPGMARGVTRFATVLQRMLDVDGYEDASLMKQRIAACLAVITSDAEGTGAPIGAVSGETSSGHEIESLEPGAIHHAAPGRTVTVVEPPAVNEHDAFVKTNLRAIAAGLGVAYEDMAGDYTDLPFSAARMSRLRVWARVEDMRWCTVIPQFCDPVFGWAMQAAIVAGLATTIPRSTWTPPPLPMIDPSAEGLAIARNVRAGIQTLSDAIRERGYDPDELLSEMAADWRKVDKLKLILDSDPRRTTQAGMYQPPTPEAIV